MPQLRYAVTIDRQVGDVFYYVADQQKTTEWQRDVIQVYQAEEPLRAGLIVSQDRATRLLGWRLDFNVDIMDYRPNKLISYEGALGRFRVEGKMQFESVRRATTVTEIMTIKMGIMYFIFSPLMSAVMKRRTRKTLDTLKAVLESGASETG